MVRKGWLAFATLSGWYNVVRGPRAGQDDRAMPNRCRWGGPNSHTTREDLRDGRRAPSIEGAWQRWRLSARRFEKRSRSLSVCFLRIWLVAMCRCKSGTLRNQRVGQHQGALVEFSSFFFWGGVISQVRRCLMPRRGWSAMEVPNGWVQVLRGPRPNSVRRPMASRNAFDSCVARSVQQHFGNLTEEFPQGTKQRVQRILGDCWQWEANGQCVKGDNCSFRHDTNKRGKVTPSNPSPNSFMQQSERKSSRTRSPRGRNPSGRMYRWPCKDYLRGTCNNSFCEKWHPPECLFDKTKSGCRFGEKCSFAHRQVDEQPTKRSKTNDDKRAVAC